MRAPTDLLDRDGAAGAPGPAPDPRPDRTGFGPVFDADAHVTEPPDVWTARVPARFRDDAPRMARDADGRDRWYIGGVETTASVGATATAGWHEPLPAGPVNFDETHPAAHDAGARLAYLDEAGIWAQVIYPNVGGFGNQAFLALPDHELRIACVQAYNDWLTEWCGHDPNRLVPVSALPFWDVDAAVAEVGRCARLGHRGVLFTGEPQRYGLPNFGAEHWNPLWAALSDHGMPVSLHLGSGDMEALFTPGRVAAHGLNATWASTAVSLYLTNAQQLVDLLFSGVLPRFPELKWVSVESGIGWVPFVLESVDRYFRDFNVWRDRPDLQHEPSEDFRRQVYVSYFFEESAPRDHLEEIGVDNVLFETDFPHAACLYGDLPAQIARGLEGHTREIRRKVLWENSARLYRIPEPPADRA